MSNNVKTPVLTNRIQYSEAAKEARRAYNKKYRHEHAEKIRNYNRAYRQKHPDKIREYNCRYWERKAAEIAAVAHE